MSWIKKGNGKYHRISCVYRLNDDVTDNYLGTSCKLRINFKTNISTEKEKPRISERCKACEQV